MTIMTRKQFLLFAVSVPGCGRASANYDANYYVKPSRLEDALTAELCSLKAPKVLYDALTRNSFYFEPGIQSEAGEDRFYEVYATKLRPVVDERFAHVRLYRAALLDAFLSANRFLDMAFRDGTGFGHLEKRLPGEIEWEILEGESKRFTSTWADAYVHDDILTVGRMVARAKFEIQGPEDRDAVDKRQMPELQRAVEHLKRAEVHLSKQGQNYFRRRLLKHVTEMI